MIHDLCVTFDWAFWIGDQSRTTSGMEDWMAEAVGHEMYVGRCLAEVYYAAQLVAMVADDDALHPVLERERA